MSQESISEHKVSNFGERWKHLVNLNTFVAEHKPSISEHFLENLYDLKTGGDDAEVKIGLPIDETVQT